MHGLAIDRTGMAGMFVPDYETFIDPPARSGDAKRGSPDFVGSDDLLGRRVASPAEGIEYEPFQLPSGLPFAPEGGYDIGRCLERATDGPLPLHDKR